MFLGIIYGLGAALSWTLSSFIWTNLCKTLLPKDINFLKNFIALIIFFPILFKINWFEDSYHISLLIISGIIGIGIGDLLYIKSLSLIGTRKTLTIDSISPVIAYFFGFLILGESLSLKSFLGIIIVFYSIKEILNQKINPIKNEKIINLKYTKRYTYAFSAIITAVIAASISRFVLTSTNFVPLETTSIRLLGAILYLLPNYLKNFNYVSNFNYIIMKKINYKLIFFIIIASIFGTNIGIYLQQQIFLKMELAKAWTVLSTAPLFSLFLAKFERDQINIKSVGLSFLTIFGVYLTINK